jgi:hypothetical protein
VNVGESIAVNVLLRYMLHIPNILGADAPSELEALSAAVKLAEAANARLGSGLTGPRVRETWSLEPPTPGKGVPRMPAHQRTGRKGRSLS